MKVDGWVWSAGILAAGLTVAGILGAGVPAVAQPAGAVTYLRASVKTGGGQLSPGDEELTFPEASVSDDGRFTAFASTANDLVPGDTNGELDVFLRDSVDDVTTRISVSSSGDEAAGDGSWGNGSDSPSMSADGRYVVFDSTAENLVPGDTNRNLDVFLRDTVAGVTTRVSLTGNGEQSRGASRDPAISPDGRFVAFVSDGALTAGDTGREARVYLRELATGRTVLISKTYDGQPVRFPHNGASYMSLAVTSGGRHVMFRSWCENLVPEDTNKDYDVFVRDVAAGTTVRASVTDSEAQVDGGSGMPSMSADGRYVAFLAAAEDLEPGTGSSSQVYVRDLVEKTTKRASILDPDHDSSWDFTFMSPTISADGRHVAFESWSQRPDSSEWKSELLVRDLDAGTTRRVTVSLTGGAPDGNSWDPTFSANGRHLAFRSQASNLVDGDTNDNEDLFVRLNVL